ncbi:hypothetical protein GCM10009795_045220 [Nocardioides hankookensis]|uniref:Contact-dependent growth inhibition system immunity protein n=1 Tax=Nocardioides hankookensis TaxID=443157 RepID=A0ABW1LQR9_9ACTN
MLWDLVGIYFNQDMSLDYGSEAAALDAFVADDPDAPKVIDEIDWIFENFSSEKELAAYLESQGSDYLPPGGDGHREWLTRIADHVRAATT